MKVNFKKGYELVLETYKENAYLITDALEAIKKTFENEITKFI